MISLISHIISRGSFCCLYLIDVETEAVQREVNFIRLGSGRNGI